MTTSLIFDYLEFVEGIKATKVIHVEDFIETLNEDPGVITCIYSLFRVHTDNNTSKLFVQTSGSSANVVVPASKQLIAEVFPDHLEEFNNSVSKLTND